MSMEVDFENYGETMSPSNFVVAARTHARVQYSSLILKFIHFESVRLKKMSRTLENLVEMRVQHVLHSITKDFQTLF